MNKKKLSKNLIITFSVYVFLLLSNIVVSKIILVSYGSETNGLLSSVNQIYAYLALLEAGIGTATVTALYKPLNEKNEQQISEICSASVIYYRSILKWYCICVILVSFLWPFILDTTIGYWTIFWVVFIHGISSAFAFYFVSTTANYLSACGKNYINVYVHMAITVITYLAKAVIAIIGGHVVVVSLALLGINLLRCLIYYLYKKIRCKNISFSLKADRKLLQQRNSFLIHEISGCIFAATDVIVISVFCDLKVASIYAVYAMVISAVSSIISQVFNSTKYILGDAYQKEFYFKTHDKFNSVYIIASFVLYTIAYLLFTPFISIYTEGINDANYIDRWLPILFVVIQLLSSCRNVDTLLIKNALHANRTINRSIIEAAINLSVSILLVNFIGIYGVLIGTIVALLYRSNDIIIYANKRILKRSSFSEYKLYLLNSLIFAAFVILNQQMPIMASGYLQLIWKAIIVACIVFIVYMLVNVCSLIKCLKK